MRGKYSPTVTAAYMADQEWHDKFKSPDEPNYDPEGFDSYGYDVNDVDRAGNHESDYYHNDGDYDLDQDFNWAYDAAYDAWGFDGTKPVLV
jgi:hypothetical protein